MKERIVIDEDFYVKHFQEREIEFQEEDMCSGGNPEEWWHYKKEKVPETFSDLQELCEKINSKLFVVDCGYTARIIITEIEFGRTMTFYDNGLVVVSADKDYEIILTENRTLSQMWQIIKNLIGE